MNKILEVLEPELVITTKELQPKFEKFCYSGRYILYEEIEAMTTVEAVNFSVSMEEV